MDPFLGLNEEDDMNWLFNFDLIPSADEITSEILTLVDINTAAVAGPSIDVASGSGSTPFEGIEQYGPFDETILFQDEHAGPSNIEVSLLDETASKKRKRHDTDEDEESPAKRRPCSTPSPSTNIPTSSSPWEDEDLFINLII